MKSFFNLLKTDLYRAILSPYFLLGTLASLLVLCMGGVGMAEKTVPAVLAFEHSYAFNNVIDLLFLSSTLAYAAQFASEWQSGYYRPVVMRSSPTQYALSKCAATGIAGGLSLAAGALMFMLWLCLSRNKLLPDKGAIEVEVFMFREPLRMGSIALFFLCYLYWLFLVGLFFSILGLTVSGWFPNQYVACASPFVAGFLINKVFQAIKPTPPNWVNPVLLAASRTFTFSTIPTLLLGTGIFLLYSLICVFFFTRTVKRRIANG